MTSLGSQPLDADAADALSLISRGSSDAMGVAIERIHVRLVSANRDVSGLLMQSASCFFNAICVLLLMGAMNAVTELATADSASVASKGIQDSIACVDLANNHTRDSSTLIDGRGMLRLLLSDR